MNALIDALVMRLTRDGQPLDRHAARERHRRWCERYSVPGKRLHGLRWDWDALRVGLVPALARRQACQALESVLAMPVSIEACNADLSIAVRFEGTLDLSSAPPDAERPHVSDLYVADCELRWTFVVPHELASGFGPYFATSELEL